MCCGHGSRDVLALPRASVRARASSHRRAFKARARTPCPGARVRRGSASRPLVPPRSTCPSAREGGPPTHRPPHTKPCPGARVRRGSASRPLVPPTLNLPQRTGGRPTHPPATARRTTARVKARVRSHRLRIPCPVQEHRISLGTSDPARTQAREHLRQFRCPPWVTPS